MLATVNTSPDATHVSLVSIATACVDKDVFSNSRVVSSSSVDSSSAYKCNITLWYLNPTHTWQLTSDIRISNNYLFFFQWKATSAMLIVAQCSFNYNPSTSTPGAGCVLCSWCADIMWWRPEQYILRIAVEWHQWWHICNRRWKGYFIHVPKPLGRPDHQALSDQWIIQPVWSAERRRQRVSMSDLR